MFGHSVLLRISKTFLLTLFALSVFLYLLKRENRLVEKQSNNRLPQRKYAFYGRHAEEGILQHVEEVMDSLGYLNTSIDDDWSLLWCHDYPFKKLKSRMMKVKPNQMVNHFPGSGYITNKVNLATSGLPYVPTAFKLPDQKDEFKDYAFKNPEKLFVIKSNNHRGINIRKITDVDLEVEGTFVQEFIDEPLLIDGYKFDIGVYIVITSINPLRTYLYDGDVLLRPVAMQFLRSLLQGGFFVCVVQDASPSTWESHLSMLFICALFLRCKTSNCILYFLNCVD